MRFQDKTIKSIGEFITHLKRDIGEYKGPVWFRGHRDKAWKLLPSFYREEEQMSEKDLINKFKQNATLIIDKNPPQNSMEWLFLMRHHGVNTRLFDWSESPLVAMYFAVEKSIR